MAKFMNEELVAIRDNLVCGHCAVTFQGSDSQAHKVKYDNRVVYCSTTCRHTAISIKLSTPIPNRGPCKTCGTVFFSRTAKLYCNLACYVKSEQFKSVQRDAIEKSMAPEVRLRMAESARRGETVACLECGTEVYSRNLGSRKRKFCTKTCYRAYLAKRFDRWIANPEGMALPQCYDEFLNQSVLPCLIQGCTWKGRHLTTHVNTVHGIARNEFKRATGFNLSTGVIARPLAELLQGRAVQGVGLKRPSPEALALAQAAAPKTFRRYRSAEAREHAQKARALIGPGPECVCVGCGVVFQKKTPFGKAMYCTFACRDRTYAEKRRGRIGADSAD
jgi:endogenous inhibitor of DNA gyrase (YacG/DUF329 family)